MKPARPSTSRQLALHVTCTRARFQSLYDDVARDVARSTGSDAETVPFLAVALDDQQQVPANDVIAFTRAFEAAEKGKWLHKLVRHCLSQAALELDAANLLPRLLGKAKRARAKRAASGERTVLQAVIDQAAGFSLPAVHAAGMLRTMPKICLITVRLRTGSTQGTGFLVGPQTVLTAWHVIEPLTDRQSRRPLPGSSQHLTVDFDFIDPLDGGSPHEAVTSFQVVDEWLEEHSPCHESERQPGAGLRDQDLDANSICQDYLDFAVIRLKGSPGRDRGVVALSPATLTDSDIPDFKLTLFQHPQRFPQRFAQGALVGFFGSGEPRPRLRHEANSEAGSSGGLCVNASFESVGLHQAAIVDGRGKPICNQAVPTALIVPKLARAFETEPELDPLWRLRNSDQPVVGRGFFQRAVWRAVAGEMRIITVSGRRRSGISFSKRILSSLLPVDETIFLEISAAEVGYDARNLATLLLTRCGGALSAGEDWPDEARSGTTSEAWVRDQLAPALARHLAVAAANRAVWMIVDDLDRHDIPEGTAYALLFALMNAEIDAAFMRFLLLGTQDRLAGLNYRQVAEDQTGSPRSHDIKSYIRRRAVHDHLEISDGECERWTQMIMRHIKNAENRGSNVWEETQKFLQTFGPFKPESEQDS